MLALLCSGYSAYVVVLLTAPAVLQSQKPELKPAMCCSAVQLIAALPWLV